MLDIDKGADLRNYFFLLQLLQPRTVRTVDPSIQSVKQSYSPPFDDEAPLYEWLENRPHIVTW